MASLESLPADQRAVLELVLQRGRSYDEIAKLLSVDRAGVRQRALAAFDALGPQTQVPPERRALIADYLLGQLPAGAAANVRDRLGSSPSDRAWAQMLAAELAPIARDPLPEIPVAPAAEPAAAAERPPSPPRRSSRRGGAILLGLGALVVIAVVVVAVLVSRGGSSSKHTSTTAGARSSTSATSASATTASVVAQVNLLPPGSGGQAKGIAQIIRVGSSEGIVLYATGVPANGKQDFYAVWLFNSPSDDYLLGFVSPGVGSDGRLQTTGALPTSVSRYKQVVVSLETQKSPKAPSKVVLQGSLSVQ